MEKLIEQEQEKPTKTRADKRTRRKTAFFPMQLINCTKRQQLPQHFLLSLFADAAKCYYRRTCAAQLYR